VGPEDEGRPEALGPAVPVSVEANEDVKAKIILQVLDEDEGWQRLVSTLMVAVMDATEKTFGPLLKEMSDKFGEGSPPVEEVRQRRARRWGSVSEMMVKPFVLVSGHELMTEEKAAGFNVFLRVVLRDMEPDGEALAILNEAMGVLRERFPGATSEEVSVPLEVMGA
jgi:hypothetical protein